MSDHRLKLARARKHLEDLGDEVGRWLDGSHHTVSRKHQPHRGEYVVSVKAEAVPRDPFATLIGDCLQNLRSGLDHLAYELAAHCTVPLSDDIAEDSEFPIFGDVDRKGRSGTGHARFGRTSPKTGDP